MRRGQSAVEFALVLPVLALLVLGMLDFGRVLHQYQAGANAAREAARFCALNPGAAQASLVGRVMGELGTLYPAADVAVTTWGVAFGGSASGAGAVSCPAAPSGQEVHTLVTIRFRAITPIVGQWLVTNAATEARAVMRVP